ncbi:MAG: transglycosylase SLT domain-containing protein [Tannerella sp.]|jgi:membrane-bound lytic murein transglycosylase D|nr:transglycosylase SLT domain-containing protein [Tannerella sp.]
MKIMPQLEHPRRKSIDKQEGNCFVLRNDAYRNPIEMNPVTGVWATARVSPTLIPTRSDGFISTAKTCFATLFFLLLFCIPAFAQEPLEEEPEEPLTEQETVSAPFDSIIGMLPDMLDTGTYNILESWHVNYFTRPEENCEDNDEKLVFPDSIYKARLAMMPCIVPMTFNETVRKCIELYANRRRNTVRYMMGMADFYFPMIEQKLDAAGLPLELKYLAVVESALNPTAQSRVGACGLWQFMLPTGKHYNLEINSLIDRRFDPEAATEAACNYFKDMYQRYGDWLLVLASYNCGPGNVDKAIRRSGGKTDFWQIFQNLPRETRSYVPLFIAAAYIMTYHCDHNICPVRSQFSVVTDTLMVSRLLHFDQIAEILQIEKDAIRFYNPQYKREIIPGNIAPSILRLPIDKSFSFIDSEDSIYSHRIDELLSACTPADASKRNEKITHTVKAGENVYTVANLYGVTAKSLRQWNGLSGSRLTPGRKLKINIDNGGLTYSSASTNPPAASSTPAATSSTASSTASSAKTTSSTGGGFISYKVQTGDTLSSIADKHKGVTVKSIQEVNGMTTTKIRTGQTLKIPKV